MKTLDHKTYYEVLEVPTDAGARDIKRAYQEALETYDDDALVTYSLFSDEQRAEILQVIERAFDTLIDNEKRTQYNRKLLDADSGVQSLDFGEDRKRNDLLSQALNISKEDSLQTWVKMKSSDKAIKALADEVIGKEQVSGKDLNQLRRAYGIELSEIYEITRISSSMITNIEQDRFEALPAEIYLKRFLRSYAELLMIEPQPIIDGYLKNMR